MASINSINNFSFCYNNNFIIDATKIKERASAFFKIKLPLERSMKIVVIAIAIFSLISLLLYCIKTNCKRTLLRKKSVKKHMILNKSSKKIENRTKTEGRINVSLIPSNATQLLKTNPENSRQAAKSIEGEQIKQSSTENCTGPKQNQVFAPKTKILTKNNSLSIEASSTGKTEELVLKYDVATKEKEDANGIKQLKHLSLLTQTEEITTPKLLEEPNGVEQLKNSSLLAKTEDIAIPELVEEANSIEQSKNLSLPTQTEELAIPKLIDQQNMHQALEIPPLKILPEINLDTFQEILPQKGLDDMVDFPTKMAFQNEKPLIQESIDTQIKTTQEISESESTISEPETFQDIDFEEDEEILNPKDLEDIALFHQKKGILYDEPLVVDIDSLDLDLTEKTCLLNGKEFTMKEVVEKVIRNINLSLIKNVTLSRGSNSLTTQRVRLVDIYDSQDLVILPYDKPLKDVIFVDEEFNEEEYSYKELFIEDEFKDKKNGYWVMKILQALIDKGHIYRMDAIDSFGFIIIQA